MANQLGMDKALAIKNLRTLGMSERAIARSLGVSRNAVRRHLDGISSNDTKAPTGSAPTGSEPSNDTTAPTGSEAIFQAASKPLSASQCEPLREVILAKLEQGLDHRRIFQDLVEEHGFKSKYWSVNRFIKSLGSDSELPFRRMEVEPGWELQVDFGAGRPCKDHTGVLRKTYIFRAVLSHSRKGYTKLIGDVPSATAILDRFLHRAELVQITGKSYRLEKSEKSSKGTKAPTGSNADN